MSTAGVSAHAPAAGPPVPAVSVRPVVIASPGRGEDLQVRVSAPVTGDGLPAVVFSHGFGWSMDAYGPLADYWAAHGLVVVQPTHLDSRRLGLPPGDPRTPDIWRIRVGDLTRVLDSLGQIEASVPGLRGRVDRGRIAAAGHSWGAQTASTRRERARAVGVWGSAIGVTIAAGPVLGGVLVGAASWRWVFWVNVPAGIAAILLTQRFIPESRAARARAFGGAAQSKGRLTAAPGIQPERRSQRGRSSTRSTHSSPRRMARHSE